MTPKVQNPPEFLSKRRQEQKVLLSELELMEQQLTELESKTRINKGGNRPDKFSAAN